MSTYADICMLLTNSHCEGSKTNGGTHIVIMCHVWVIYFIRKVIQLLCYSLVSWLKFYKLVFHYLSLIRFYVRGNTVERSPYIRGYASGLHISNFLHS